MKRSILLVCLILLLSYSCSVNSNLYLSEEQSGHLESRVELADFFSEFFFDIFERESILNELTYSLEQHEGLQDIILDSNGNRFHNHFQFDSIHSLPGLSQGILLLEEENGIKTLTIQFHRNNWHMLEELIPILKDPSLSYMGPMGSEGLSREEFREMLIYPFEGYASDQASALSALDRSKITLNVQVEGEILQVEGGVLLDNHKAQFQLPLFDLLMLDRPLIYRLSYR